MKGKIQYPIWLLPVLFPATFCSRTAVTRKPPGSSTERLLAEATQRVPTVGILRRVPHRKTNRCSLHVEAQSCLSADRKDNRIKGIPVPFLPSSPSYEPGKIPLPIPIERINPGVADTQAIWTPVLRPDQEKRQVVHAHQQLNVGWIVQRPDRRSGNNHAALLSGLKGQGDVTPEAVPQRGFPIQGVQ